MIINSAPQAQAIMSNVGQIGEFRIRNSAKAFSILSSGLYANKIRAIIRELSCNAVDSHVAAGKASTPFDVHLPNTLAPHFSIRDYGTGLTHDQVTNIYTTYFESTKTDSNALIGALGLGSKSPFSYTDNFTVTAIKDGSKRIYTSFINENGVPSIALMTESDTTEPNGVEVKFSVNDRYDFEKFKQEARAVYKYFTLKPVVSGVNDFAIPELKYLDMNIIPGVHAAGGNSASVAIMGNIAYPIDVPNSESTLGKLRELLSCGLVMEFNIGELDFQASREGLSYIPSTIEAIKSKLEALNAQLAVHIATEADAITNEWERAYLLSKKYTMALWRSAVSKYVADTKFELFDPTTYGRTKVFSLEVSELATKYNINIRSFYKSGGSLTCHNTKPSSSYNHGVQTLNWSFGVGKELSFVVTDTKVGALERAKYHYKKNDLNGTVITLEKADKTKEMNTTAFFAAISNPPNAQIVAASCLDSKERAGGMGRNVTILKLELREYGSWRRRNSKTVWANAGKADSFDKNVTHYYVPLNGYVSLGKVSDVKALQEHLNGSGIYTGEVYGVRKADIEFILTQKNWINLDTYVSAELSKLGQTDIMSLVKQSIDVNSYFKYNVFDTINENSPYKKLHLTFKDVKEADPSRKHSVEFLCKVYGITTNQNIDPTALIAKYRSELNELKERYPLLSSIGHYNAQAIHIAEYINLVDDKKGI